jgi:glycine/D-amino acid oxidase-like deaminating enzyme
MTKLLKIKVAVLVIGGGIVGAIGADYFSELGYSLLLLRVTDEGFPRSDTLSNHGWLHTGPWYWLKWDKSPHLLTALRQWSQEMLNRYKILPGPGPAIFSTDNPERALLFQDKARQLGYRIKTYTEEQARRLLCVPSIYNFEVKDRPFSPATVIRMARNNARRNGAQLRDLSVNDRVRLVRDPRSPNGFVVHAGGYVIEAGLTILSAGAGTPAMLEQLDLKHKISVSRSILIITPSHDQWKATVSGNMDTGLTIVRHDSDLSPTGSFEVIGGKGRVPIGGEIWTQRVPTDLEIENLFEQFPDQLRMEVEKAGYEVTAGLKTEAANENGESHAVPYVEVINREGIKNLVVALPGKATFGLYTVHTVAQECDLAEGDYALKEKVGDQGPESGQAPSALPGEKWMAMPKMHWDYPKQSRRGDESKGLHNESDDSDKERG